MDEYQRRLMMYEGFTGSVFPRRLIVFYPAKR